MANVDAAFGFRPIGNDGGVYTGQTRRCAFIATGSTVATFVGDPVKLDNVDGVLGEEGGAYQAVIIATAGDPVYGVVTAFEANPDDLSAQYRKASTARFCQVAIADNTFFEVQDSANQGLAGVGANAGYVIGAGSAVTGLSATEIVTATVANTGDVQLISIVDDVENDGTLSNARWVVKFNDPQGKPVRTGT
jgi:hypothetical protein